MRYKRGDKVRVRDWERRPSHWNSSGEMDHWINRIVTVKRYTQKGRIKIFEDILEYHGNGWFWQESDFESNPLPVVELEEGLFEL